MLGLLLVSVVMVNVKMAFASEQHRTVQNCEVYVYGVSSKESIFKDGSNNQFSGIKKTISFDLGIEISKLDSKIKRVGFQGLREESVNSHISSYPYDFSFSQIPEKNGIWTASVVVDIKAHGQENFKYNGAFFVETVNGTYYWLKTVSQKNFYFDSQTAVSLSKDCAP